MQHFLSHSRLHWYYCFFFCFLCPCLNVIYAIFLIRFYPQFSWIHFMIQLQPLLSFRGNLCLITSVQPFTLAEIVACKLIRKLGGGGINNVKVLLLPKVFNSQCDGRINFTFRWHFPPTKSI